MQIEIEHYTREEIRDNRQNIYVFGDNFVRKGFGGQAKECRGESNAVGIPTKRSPYIFLTDEDYDEWVVKSTPYFNRIVRAAMEGKTIVWPKDGIGTGRAELRYQAPRIWEELQRRIKTIRSLG